MNHLFIINTRRSIWLCLRLLLRSDPFSSSHRIGQTKTSRVYVEVGIRPIMRHTEALYAIELCKDKSNPTVGAVIAVDIRKSDFKEYMSEFENTSYIKGIRSSFRSPEEILSEQVVENIRILGIMNLSFEFSLPPKWLSQMAELISLCPSTLFIVEHCGNGNPQAFLNSGESF